MDIMSISSIVKKWKKKRETHHEHQHVFYKHSYKTMNCIISISKSCRKRAINIIGISRVLKTRVKIAERRYQHQQVCPQTDKQHHVRQQVFKNIDKQQ